MYNRKPATILWKFQRHLNSDITPCKIISITSSSCSTATYWTILSINKTMQCVILQDYPGVSAEQSFNVPYPSIKPNEPMKPFTENFALSYKQFSSNTLLESILNFCQYRCWHFSLYLPHHQCSRMALLSMPSTIRTLISYFKLSLR